MNVIECTSLYGILEILVYRSTKSQTLPEPDVSYAGETVTPDKSTILDPNEIETLCPR